VKDLQSAINHASETGLLRDVSWSLGCAWVWVDCVLHVGSRDM